MKKEVLFGMGALTILAVSGCTLTEQHTAGGAVTGAAIGGLLTGDARGALVGGLAGGAIGNVHGQNQQQHQNTQTQMQQLQQQANQTTIWLTNSNGSKTPVTLSKAVGGQWIGPRGEVYPNLPSEDQLQPLYAF